MGQGEVALRVQDLHFRYSKHGPELYGGLSFDCVQGTLTVVEGENGSGKSTLVRLIAGIRRPTKGSITTHVRSGFLPQSTAGLNPQLTGNEHLALFGSAIGLRPTAIQNRSGELLDRLRFDRADLKAPTARLSGGNKQKLSLALTMLDDSAGLLLLDEPYSGFDTASFTAFIDLLVDLKAQGVAILMVNHLVDPRLPVDQDITVARLPKANHVA